MTLRGRIKFFLIACLQIVCVVLLLIEPQTSQSLVIFIIQVVLILAGIRYLIFYYTMARHMVNGKAILYKGAIYLDLGVFLEVLSSLPSVYLMLYVVGYFALNGVFRCLKMMDTRKLQDSSWIRIGLVAGWYLMLAMIGIFNLHSQVTMVYLFCVEMANAAIGRLIRVFRKTAIVYIQ